MAQVSSFLWCSLDVMPRFVDSMYKLALAQLHIGNKIKAVSSVSMQFNFNPLDYCPADIPFVVIISAK